MRARRRLPWWASSLFISMLLGLALAPVPASAAPPLLGLPTAGLNASQVPAGQHVFTSPAAWTQFWRQYSRAPAPLVDFSRWQVVAVFLGPRPNAGYDVTITDYVIQGSRLTVRVREWTPAPGSVSAQVITYPADLVAVPAGPEVSFARTSGPRALLSPVARDLPASRLDPSSLSAEAPEQFVAFTDATSWQQFWRRHGRGPAPPVDFAGGRMVIGVVGFRSRAGATLSHLTRAGDLITLTLGPAGQTCPGTPGQNSLLLLVPQVPRVDYRLLPYCR